MSRCGNCHSINVRTSVSSARHSLACSARKIEVRAGLWWPKLLHNGRVEDVGRRLLGLFHNLLRY